MTTGSYFFFIENTIFFLFLMKIEIIYDRSTRRQVIVHFTLKSRDSLVIR